MNKSLLALVMLTTLAAQPAIQAQTHRHTPRSVVVSASVDADSDTAGIAAYSDTTAVGAYPSSPQTSYQDDSDDGGLNEMLRGMSLIGNGLAGTVLIVFMLFILSPLLILALLFYFIYKSRKQKMQLAEMAMKSGRPIPDSLLDDRRPADEQLWRKGIKNAFLGIGLMCLFGICDFSMGVGIGLLVMFCGVGQLVIARTSASKHSRHGDLNEPTDDRNL